MHPAARWTAAGKWNGWTRNFTSTRCVPSVPLPHRLCAGDRADRRQKLLWQLDPYASNKDYTAPGGYVREGQLLQTIDTAFITPQALPDYEGGPLSSWRGKVQVLGFPVLLPGGRCLRTRGCGAYFAAVCTPRYGSRILRWNCLPR